MAERYKLKITTAPKTSEDGHYCSFYATGSTDGKTWKYNAFNSALKELVKKDSEIDAEVEVKQSPDKKDRAGNPVIYHNLANIYQADGQPVVKKTSPAARSYNAWAPVEEMRANRASTEQIAAAQMITSLELAGKVVKPDLLKMRDAWLSKTLTIS
jgi:hypothetical protein